MTTNPQIGDGRVKPLSLTVLGSISGRPVETLDKPESVEEVKRWLVEEGYAAVQLGEKLKKFIKDGLYVKGNFSPEELQQLVSATIQALHTVKDEHMPTSSMVDCGFLRILCFSKRPDGKVGTAIFMRFTIDHCPAGKRLAEISKAAVLNGTAKLGVDEVSIRHGGTPWKPEDGSEKVRTILQILTAADA